MMNRLVLQFNISPEGALPVNTKRGITTPPFHTHNNNNNNNAPTSFLSGHQSYKSDLNQQLQDLMAVPPLILGQHVSRGSGAIVASVRVVGCCMGAGSP